MCCANTGYQWTIEDFLFNRGPFQPSLDAIVPKQGHVKGNIQWICWFTNSTNNDKKKNENVDYSRSAAVSRDEWRYYLQL